MSKLEDQLATDIHCYGLPEPTRQYRLPELPGRRFAYDFAWVEQRLLVEVQGSTWVPNTGHTSGTGLERDTEKLCLAIVHGYRVLCVTRKQIESEQAVQWIEQALNGGRQANSSTSLQQSSAVERREE